MNSPASRNNNFDLLRLLAAFLVLVSHSLGLLQPVREDVLPRWTNGQYSMAYVGLIIFFSISGYLVTESLLKSQSIYDYAWKRFLRIWPACFVVTLLTVFVLGPAVTTLSHANYFSNALTWKFLLNNTFILNNPRQLPGVFDQQDVNISLWTLPVEIRLYGMLLLLYLAGAFSHRWLQGLFFAGVVCGKIFLPYQQLHEWFHFDFKAWYDHGFYFITGSTLYVWRDRIKINYKGVLILGSIWCITSLDHLEATIIAPVFLTYFILFTGFRLPVLFKPSIDISYGIYLYSTPVLLTALHIAGRPLFTWQYVLVVIPTIILLAYFSWKLVESKVLQLKRKRS